MNLPRSTFYADTGCEAEDPAIHEIRTITETCRGYGYRRVTAELRHRGMVVNAKKVRRIMRENGWSPKRKHRYVVTTDSNHDSPIYPNVALNYEVHGPDQLWVRGTPCAVQRGRHNLRGDRYRICLPRRHSGRLVAQGRGLCTEP